MSYPAHISDFKSLILPSTTRVVLLDFDNTCYQYEPCHTPALAAAREHLEKEVGAVLNFYARYQAAQQVVKRRIPTHAASHSRILYFQSMLEALGGKNLVSRAHALERVYWDTFMTRMQPVPGLMDFLAQCRQNGTTVAVVSDLTTTIQCEKLTALGIATYVDVLVTSEETGAEKPDPRCFTLALEKAGVRAEEAVMIGDNYERDIKGAEALGIPAIQFIHEAETPATPLR